jgi:hypothetical protein
MVVKGVQPVMPIGGLWPTISQMKLVQSMKPKEEKKARFVMHKLSVEIVHQVKDAGHVKMRKSMEFLDMLKSKVKNL